jgi:hypothetical protein
MSNTSQISTREEDSWDVLKKKVSRISIPKERTKFVLSSILHM